MSLSKMAIKQELTVKSEVMSYQILNKLREQIVKKIKSDTSIVLIEGAITEKDKSLLQGLTTIPNMVTEDSDTKKEKIDKFFREIVTDLDLKNIIKG